MAPAFWFTYEAPTVCSVCSPHLKQVERPAVHHSPMATLTQDQWGRGPDTKCSVSEDSHRRVRPFTLSTGISEDLSWDYCPAG